MTRASWKQPCCDACWQSRNPGTAPVRMLRTQAHHETCVFCGLGTESGIYVSIDPKEAPYPTLTKE